jgi:hypothetical protein
MKEALDTLVALHAEVPVNRVDAYQRLVSTVVGFFITAVVLSNVLYFPSITSKLNKSIKGNRALLLLLPEDVVSGVLK